MHGGINWGSKRSNYTEYCGMMSSFLGEQLSQARMFKEGYLRSELGKKVNDITKTEANLCSCQSPGIIAPPWHNGSPGRAIFPLRLYLRYLEGFPSAPDFSRETSQTGMTMDFQWLIIMPLSWASFALRLIWM